MSFLFANRAPEPKGKLDLEFLHKMECKACPLAKLPNRHPDMPPSGADQPLIYALGEAPGADEDEADEPFVGASGRKLRGRVPREFRDLMRFNNTVRTRPLNNETPSPTAMECCRPSVVADIEATKPKVILGFGDVPLRWVSGFSGITHWRGRRMPVKVGAHTCWYYPMLHPAYLIYEGRRGDSEAERMFKLDMERAFREIDHLPKPVVHDTKTVFNDIDCITAGGRDGLEQVEHSLSWAMDQPGLGIDYETDRLRPYDKSARLLSVAVDSGKMGFAFPWDHPYSRWSDKDLVVLAQMWRKFLKQYQGRKWVHNLAFELEWTAVHLGEDLVRAGFWEDTASQAVVLDERVGTRKPGCFSLEFLTQLHFGFNLKSLTNLDRKVLADTPVEVVLRYNGADARYHKLLGEEQEVLIADEGLQEAYRLAFRRVPTVVLSQVKGTPVDQKVVTGFQVKYEDRLQALDDEIFDLPVVRDFAARKGEKFKPLSNPDVLYVMRDMLRRSECEIVDKFSKDSRAVKYSVDESVLERINHPLAELIVRYRKANKQLSTYVYPLLKGHKDSVLFDDDMLHTVFNTLFAETGRLSSDSPNLQNFPKRDGEAKEVRKQVAAPLGHSVLAVDYGQIEARVIAMFTKDKRFVKALWENFDIHMEWAERLSRAYPARVGGKKFFTDKKVMKDFRTDIKNQWTFPLFFGAKLESAAGYLSIPPNVLKPHYEEFWHQFSGVKDWQDETWKFYEQNGYVECLTGRRRRGPLSLNQVMNSPVQGTAAEIVMDAMARLSETGDRELQPEINIHDDFTYCTIPNDRLEQIAEKIIGLMLDVPFEWAHIVPISVEASVGPNWCDLEEIGTFSSDKW